jgi:hypothetical protein
MMDFFLTAQIMKWLGIKTKLSFNPILVHMAQGMVKPVLKITSGVDMLGLGTLKWYQKWHMWNPQLLLFEFLIQMFSVLAM